MGDPDRLPPALRERAASVPGGASVPLTLESWRLMDGQLRGWISPGRQALRRGAARGPPGAAGGARALGVHEEPTFVLAPGHDPAQLEAFAALAAARCRCKPRPRRRRRGSEHARLPAIRADPFCVPELDAFLAAHGTWVAPAALALLQEIREEHARAAGLVALSAATDAPLEVPRASAAS